MVQPTYDDVNLILRLYEMRREEKMREARDWFVRNFKPKTMEEFQQVAPVGSQENAYFRQVTSYWEMVASFMTQGVLNKEMFYQSGMELLLCWTRVRHIAAAVRDSQQNPKVWRNMEAVATEMIAWLNRDSPTAYEAFVKRIGG
jgi:hypothetical protein